MFMVPRRAFARRFDRFEDAAGRANVDRLIKQHLLEQAGGLLMIAEPAGPLAE